MIAGNRGCEPLWQQAMPRRDRRPLHYRMGSTLRVAEDRIEMVGLDGRTVRIRLAKRTLFVLGDRRLAGPRALRPGNQVRVASVDTAFGPVAVLVELLGMHPAVAGPRATAMPAVTSRAISRGSR